MKYAGKSWKKGRFTRRCSKTRFFNVPKRLHNFSCGISGSFSSPSILGEKWRRTRLNEKKIIIIVKFVIIPLVGKMISHDIY
jgi:hypothetical protein